MGKTSRMRRAAKQRQRRREGGARRPRESGPFGMPGGWGGSDPERDLQAALVEAIGADLLAAASDYVAGDSDAPRRCVVDLLRPDTPFGPETVAQIGESLLGELVPAMASGGWQPADLVQAHPILCEPAVGHVGHPSP